VRYKPSLINESIFWNTDFSLGVGLLPTQLVTGGLLGFLSWVALILSVVLLGLRYLLSPVADKLKRYLSVSSFFGALFLWAFFIFYTPSVVILTLTFLFTGVFIASLYNERLLKPKTISFIDEPRVSFVSVLLLTALLVGVVALSYILGKDFVASGYFQRALIAIDAQNDLGTAESYTKHALALSANDLYNRLLSEVALRKLNVLLAGANSAENPDAIRTQFQTLMGDAVSYARKAVELDSTNYQNWIALGRVYEAVIPLSVEGAYEGAAAAYEKALALNPKGPQIRLIEARLELARGKNDAAIANINEALALKHNYTEAVFLLSQVQVSEGKVKEAIASVESVAVLSPTDPTVFFQLGILKYNNRDYRGALEALERAVFLAPTYSNAKYFLGLSYYRTNMVDKALTQFNDILVLNPTNTEVPTIIANLKAGRDPFANLTASERPDKRNTLPVKEPRVEETTP
jgi:tetratricopeptide (TPR) repeat protein